MTTALLVPVVAGVALTVGLATHASAAGSSPLGAAASFAVLGTSAVTNTGPSAISGDVGVSPTTSITGFPPGQITNGTLHAGDAQASQAHADAAVAYDHFAAQVPTGSATANLGGTTVTPGVYAETALALTGTVVLDAQNDPDATFVFQSASTFITAASANVELRNGASACNVFWQLGTSATIGTNTHLAGTVLAHASITATTGATVDGHLLAVGAAVTMDSNAITAPDCTKANTTVALSSSLPSTRFGTAIDLTAVVRGSSSTGSVSFADVPASGAHSGETLALGSAVLANGVAQLTVVLPAFGANVVTATYGGDDAHNGSYSTPVTVQVNAYVGEVIVTEFRASGPAGSGDSYVELRNTGPAVPLGGFVVRTDVGTSTTLPSNAGTLGTARSYLLTGPTYSLSTVGTADDSGVPIGAGGVQVLAPDTDSTVTDAAGPTDGFHLGTGLAPLAGATPGGQYAWVRTEVAGAAVNSGDNAADFQLVSTTGTAIGGAQSTLGSPSPIGTADPYQHNVTLRSTLLDAGVASTATPNRLAITGPPGTLTLRRTITNTAAGTVHNANVRISAISEANGVTQAGRTSVPARTAELRATDPATATTVVTLGSGATVLVHNLSPDDPATSSNGGGLNTTLTVPLPVGGLLPGASVDIAITLTVDVSGTYWLGYDVDASDD
ncbi:ice-binding family protein [uncultured Jatrophihabitans sp.]|uniref:ice-binding family protein n=1 Tax=uncultured Jatrophihabitans sp. TaxID=1610747 RepID=UPI0035C9BB2A